MKTLKKLIIQITAMICIIACLTFSASAYSTTTTDFTTISPTKNDFKNAKEPVYNSISHSIYDSILTSYEMDIIHYEAQHDGYYAIYTTGDLDTVGKVYEHENLLFITTKYEEIGYNDDFNNQLNYKMILDLMGGEDYYICTRGYNKKTGYYTLMIKPNNDAVESNIGGKWINDNMDFNDSLLGSTAETESKVYYTKEQVKLYYQLLRNEATRALIKNSYTRNGALGTIEALVDLGFTMINLITLDSLLPEYIEITPSDLIIDFTEGALNLLFDSFYEDVDSIADIMAGLETAGDAGYIMQNGVDVYYANNGVCITTTAFEAITNEEFDYTLLMRENSYSTYNNSKIVGVDYEKGHWE